MFIELNSVKPLGLSTTKKKYADIGDTSNIPYSNKVAAYNCNGSILQSLKEYLLQLEGVNIGIMLDIDESMFFYINRIYLRINQGTINAEAIINPKDSINYMVLAEKIRLGDFSFFANYLSMYKDYILGACDCVLEDLGISRG